MSHSKQTMSAVKWAAAAVCAVVFCLLALFMDRLEALDQTAYSLVSRLASPPATAFFTAVTALGGWLTLLVLCFVLVLALPDQRKRVPLLLNVAISVLMNLGLKSLFARTRPAGVAELLTETGYSFPSGHTMAAACFYGFLIFLVLRSPLRKGLRRALSAFLALLVALIGLSRVYLGAHYFTDVLGGLCVSVPYLALYTAFWELDLNPKPRRFGPGTLLASVSFALEGIAAGFRAERNMVIHFAVTALVVVFGGILGLTAAEWMICILLFGLVLAAELMNTAVETVVNMITREVDPRAKFAKDTAAGAVLLLSIAAAIIGVIIFAPKLFAVVKSGLLRQTAP